MTILGLYNKVKQLNIDNVIDESFDETSDQLAELNIQQMLQGEDSLGGELGIYRNEEYAAEKHRMNPLPGFGVVDLRLTGAFHRGIYVRRQGDEIIEGSTDQKADELERNYSLYMWGLNSNFKPQYLQEYLGPVLHKKITAITGLKFAGE